MFKNMHKVFWLGLGLWYVFMVLFWILEMTIPYFTYTQIAGVNLPVYYHLFFMLLFLLNLQAFLFFYVPEKEEKKKKINEDSISIES